MTTDSKTDQKVLDQLKKFLATKRVLIADPNGPSRAGVAKLLISLGVKTQNVSMVPDFDSARSDIRDSKPEIVITEYLFHNGNGLDLTKELEKVRKQNEKIFMLVTANSSQSLVAQAAEEDIDSFILKPYTVKYFTDTLIKAMDEKTKPPHYIKTIEFGKNYIAEGKNKEALEIFNEAIHMDAKPSLAFYYKARAENGLSKLEDAENSYKNGLKHNEIHYKCLSGLYDLLINNKDYNQAYSVAKKTASVFPASPARLSQVLSLAVKTNHMEDIEEFYDMFKNIETRNDDLVRYVTAALIVSAKHFFTEKDSDKALRVLRKATISAAGRTNFLKEIAAILSEQNRMTELEDIMKRFPAEVSKSIDYEIVLALRTNLTETDTGKVLKPWMDLKRAGSEDPIVLFNLIKYMKKFGKKEESESNYDLAMKKWPNLKDYFDTARSS